MWAGLACEGEGLPRYDSLQAVGPTEGSTTNVKYQFEERRVVCRGEHYIAPNATVIGSVVLEHNASVWFNAVIRGDNDEIVIGEGSNVQDGSVLHTDPGVKLIIGRGVTVGHMVMLHGCEIGDNTLIGIKSVILNNVKIGKNCIIGANSLITEGKQIPDNSLVMGSPGKVVREINEKDLLRIRMNAENYVQKIPLYRRAFTLQD
jgi:carbonic anhydrase/acetyltransferase-like protein (isoleucine patch superfamily)